MTLRSLPIDAVLGTVVGHLETRRALVIQATPGSGKTTRVPPALLRAPFLAPGAEVVVLEPRRLAAKWAAHRVAEELGEPVGKTVGYQFRFENVGGPATRLRFLTEGMLIRRFLSDPFLRSAGVVVLDEFHERHLHTDVALSYLRWLQLNHRPDLRIVVMSATLDAGALSTYLDDCPVVSVEARQFPVNVEYLPGPAAKPLPRLVADAAASAIATGEGDLLVFLPGMADIRRASEALQTAAVRGARILTLHGELSREEQDAALKPVPGKRKIILSTNVAETSLTIEGVTTVIDSGLHRQASYSWWSGVPALRTRAISRASATQRAGRAGRLGPGRCFRLYTRGDFDGRAAFDVPELERADLSQMLLELKALGVTLGSGFPWFQAPPPAALEAAVDLLFRLGALEARALGAPPTPLGRRLSRIPTHPRLSRLLLAAQEHGVPAQGATLAALISEGDLESLDAFEGIARDRLSEGARKLRQQLGSHVDRSGTEAAAAPDWQQALGRALLTAFPDRVARKREGGGATKRAKAEQVELVFSAGGSALVEENAFLGSADTFIALDVQEQKSQFSPRAELRVRSLCSIDPAWLFDVAPDGVRESEEYFWDERRQRVLRAARLAYGQLVLDEEIGPPGSAPGPQALAALLKGLFSLDEAKAERLSLQDWIPLLAPLGEPDAVQIQLARLLQFSRAFPEEGLPDLGAAGTFWPALKEILVSRLAREELTQVDWGTELLSALAPDRPQLPSRLDREVPAFLVFPHGRRVRVHYELEQPPWIESRLQDFFGMKTGPSILGGRVRLTLHLLAPNQRAVQVTSDLAGFWERGYSEIRRELSRRYPKHAWPENPLLASPPPVNQRYR